MNIKALKASLYCLHRAMGALEDRRRHDEAKLLGEICGVQVFNVGELQAAITMTLRHQEDRALLEELLLTLSSYPRSTKVFTAPQRKAAS